MKKFELVSGNYSGVSEDKISSPQKSKTIKDIPTPKELLEAPDLRKKLEETFGQTEKQEVGFLDKMTHSALQGAEIPAELLSSLVELISGYKLRPKKTGSELFRDRFTGSFEAQNPLEHYALKVAQQTPVALAFGPGAALRTAASALPASLAGSLGGLSPIGQDILQIGLEIGSGAIRRAFKNISLSQGQKDASKALVESVSKAELEPIKGVQKAIKESKELLSSESNPKIRNAVQEVYSTIASNIKPSVYHPRGVESINPFKLSQLRKNIGRDIAKNKDLTGYLAPIRESITDTLKQYGTKNPKFWNALDKRDQLTLAKKMSATIIDKLPKISFLEFKGAKDLLEAGELLARRYIKYPQARKLYNEALGEILHHGLAKGKEAETSKNLVNIFNKMFGKKVVELPKTTNKEQSRFELVSGTQS